MGGALMYNQKKVDKRLAQLLAVRNIQEAEREAIRRAFERYERLNIKTKNVSFQMSINPNPQKEKLTDAEAVDYATKLMEGLGYKDQPFVIYRHNDIERTHYHVISIRTDEKGKKIKDSYEHQRLQQLMMKYQKEFHYKIGADELKEIKRNANPGITLFDPSKRDIRQQINAIFDSALKYRFTTVYQFVTVMQGLGVKVDVSNMEPWTFAFQGLDNGGKAITDFIPESELGREFYKECQQACEQWKKTGPTTTEEKKEERRNKFRTGKIVEYCLKASRSEKHLLRMLDKKNIGLSLSRTDNDEKKIFGSTIVDHNTLRVYKGSDLGAEVTAEKFQEAQARWDAYREEEKQKWIAQRKEDNLDRRIAVATIKAQNDYGTYSEEDKKLYDEITDVALCVLDEMLKDGTLYNQERKEKERRTRREFKPADKPQEETKKKNTWKP